MAEIIAEPRVAQNVVTGETREAFMAHRLDLKAPAPSKVEVKVETPPPVEPVKEPVKDPEDLPHEPEPATDKLEKPKNPINERFAKMAEQRRQAEAKAEAAEKRALEAETARVAAEAKLNPPQKKEIGDTPTRSQFTSDDDYIQALTDHKVEKAISEREQKAQEEREKQSQTQRLDTYKSRIEKAKTEIPDFEEKIESSTIKISDQVKEAIIDSELAPQILVYLADHPEEAEEIGKLTVGGALRRLGRLEEKLEKPEKEEKKPDLKVVKSEPEISKAPAPISALKGASAPAESKVDSTTGEFKGTYQEWKKLRKEGRI
jgi:hypothetical protein